MNPILLLIPLSEFFGLLGFVYLASDAAGQNLRQLPLMMAIILVIVTPLFLREIGGMSMRKLLNSAIFLSLFSVAILQVFGLLFFGFSKDIDFLSFENFMRSAVIFIAAFISHFSILIMCHLIRK